MLPTGPRAVLTPGAEGQDCADQEQVAADGAPPASSGGGAKFMPPICGQREGSRGLLQPVCPVLASPVPTPVTAARSFWIVSLAPACPDDWP